MKMEVTARFQKNRKHVCEWITEYRVNALHVHEENIKTAQMRHRQIHDCASFYCYSTCTCMGMCNMMIN